MEELLQKRALLFGKSEKWSGWFCQRCCWNMPLPIREDERAKLAREIEKLFKEHSCETFSPKHWRTNA